MTKAIPVLLPDDGEASKLLLPSSVSFLSDATVQPESTYCCILKMTSQVYQKNGKIGQALVLITGIISIYLPTVLTNDSDSFLTNILRDERVQD